MVEPWHTFMRVIRDALRRVRGKEDDPSLPFAPEYDRVFASLTRAELYGDSTSLIEEDIVADLFGREHRANHFLDFYSEKGAKLAFERYGFFQLLRDKGFEPRLAVDLDDADEHKLRIYDRTAKPDNLLIELGAGRRALTLPDDTDVNLLFINWLMMQNPRASFPPDRAALPDQEHPGLGLFPHFGYLLRLMALRLECDGLINHPAHFHNAQLYGRFFHFVDPTVEGRFRALERDLAELPLATATLAVDGGRVRDEDGEVLVWKAHPQISAMTNRTRAWFASEGYQSSKDRAEADARFVVESPASLD